MVEEAHVHGHLHRHGEGHDAGAGAGRPVTGGELVRDAAGAPQYFISVIEDISDRKAAEAALAESEARLQFDTQIARLTHA